MDHAAEVQIGISVRQNLDMPMKSNWNKSSRTSLQAGFFLLLLALLALQVAASRASVDDAHSFALQSAEPYVRQGYQVREDYWGGDLGVGEKKAVRQQLFKGNDYWFWYGLELRSQQRLVVSG